jgi:PAS domain S-box-containing protein
MAAHIATGLTRWVRGAEGKIFHAARLNIGPRLVLGFGLIIMAMLAADAVVLWQFRVVTSQAARLSDIDQARIAVLRVHTGLLAFHDRLDALADSEDVAGLTTEAGQLQTTVLEDIRRATSAVGFLPVELQRDPTILPTLHVVQSTVRSQLDAITTLATAGDWSAVQLQLTNQIRPLESLTSTLVERVDQDFSQVQAQTAQNLARVQRRVFLIVPMTALLALLIAATMGLAITRSITQPLERLVGGSKALALGDFEHQVAIKGDDELARLGNVFNDTARRLRDLYATVQSREDSLRLVIDTIPAFVWSGLPDGTFDLVSRSWLDYIGCTWEELSARGGLSSALHPDDVEVSVGTWKKAREVGRHAEHELRMRRSDGEYRWFLSRAQPLRDERGNVVRWYGTVIDITERRSTEDALRRSEAALHEAQQISHTGSWRWQIGSGEVSLSAELGRILAVDPTGTLPSAEEWIAMTHADDRPAFQDVLERAVSERRRFDHEYRFVRVDGIVKRLHILGRPDDTVSGELEYTGVVMDITERRHAEEALRDAQAELERAARLTTMGELAASIAHEINQPLAAIVSQGSAGLRWLKRETPELDEARDAFEQVVSNGQRAADVIRGLRALAKKSGPQPTTLDIDDAIDEVLMLTRNEVERHGVALRIDLAVGDTLVMGDRVQLQQVMVNLILNAVDAMKAVTERARVLSVSSGLTEPDCVLIAIEDSGPGLDPTVAPRIFDPFVTTKPEGLGMGLSICRSIIDAHGGRLWVSPAVPHGTLFRFTLPTGVAT